MIKYEIFIKCLVGSGQNVSFSSEIDTCFIFQRHVDTQSDPPITGFYNFSHVICYSFNVRILLYGHAIRCLSLMSECSRERDFVPFIHVLSPAPLVISARRSGSSVCTSSLAGCMMEQMGRKANMCTLGSHMLGRDARALPSLPLALLPTFC